MPLKDGVFVYGTPKPQPRLQAGRNSPAFRSIYKEEAETFAGV